MFFFALNQCMSYCTFVLNGAKDSVHKPYHDKEYRFPLKDDNELFARLILEINQPGLSWETILKKKNNFFKAFDNFDIDKVSRYPKRKLKSSCRMRVLSGTV